MREKRVAIEKFIRLRERLAEEAGGDLSKHGNPAKPECMTALLRQAKEAVCALPPASLDFEEPVALQYFQRRRDTALGGVSELLHEVGHKRRRAFHFSPCNRLYNPPLSRTQYCGMILHIS